MDNKDMEDILVEDKVSTILSGSCPQSICGDDPQFEAVDAHEQYHPLHQDGLERNRATDSEGGQQFSISRSRRSRSTVSHSQYRALQELRNLKTRMERVEAQCIPQSHKDKTLVTTSKEPNTTATFNRKAQPLVENCIRRQTEHPPIIAERGERTWPNFMNKSLDEDFEYAIEILKGLPDYQQPKSEDLSANRAVRQGPDSSSEPSSEELPWSPERIRINSVHILNFLSSFDKNIDPSVPWVMLRPFKPLIHYDRQIHECFDMLKEDSLKKDGQVDQVEVQDTMLKHVECLIAFIEEFVRPRTQHFAENSTTSISFDDLYHIFQPGVDIYMPIKIGAGLVARESEDVLPEAFRGLYNMMWRVTGVGGGRVDLAQASNRKSATKPHSFKVNCYYIDFDGRYFFPTNHTFNISPYEGERAITSLDFHPVRFLPDAKEKLQKHSLRGGETFKAITCGYQHFYYAGWTVATQPCGCTFQDTPMRQEYVESEVIVDFKQTVLEHPDWRPKLNYCKKAPISNGEVMEMHRIQHWSDKAQTTLLNTESDYVYNDNLIDIEIADSFKDRELIFSPIHSALFSNADMVPKNDYILLPGRVFGFILRSRKFAPLWLWALSPIRKQEDSLRCLQLRDNTFKETVQTLVRSHFSQRGHVTEKSGVEYDFTRGKGKGLIILLHGVPGTGKTSTAESVAAANGKPLFQITCGDLGLTPGEVESNLKEIFRFAQIWNCILLLDECEIFLTQRDKNDVTRNALVSVFLRTLEFYTGVLFLTTNRVGVLDDAIKSRLSWTEYYPPLEAKQAKEIWRINLRLLQERNNNIDVDEQGIMEFARNHFKRSLRRQCRWNGRQIQNAIKVATTLAIDSNATIDDPGNQRSNSKDQRPKLLASHFEMIAKGTRAFDDYLREATGFTEEEKAFNRMERKDDYMGDDEHYDSQNSYQRSLHSRRERKSSAASVNWSGHPTSSLAPPQHETARPTQNRRRSSNKHHQRHSVGLTKNTPTPAEPWRYPSNPTVNVPLDPPIASPRDTGMWPTIPNGRSRTHRRERVDESSESSDSGHDKPASYTMDGSESWNIEMDDWEENSP